MCDICFMVWCIAFCLPSLHCAHDLHICLVQQIPLFGIMSSDSADPFYWMRVILASNRGLSIWV